MTDRLTPEHEYTISSPCEPNGSGKLKLHHQPADITEAWPIHHENFNQVIQRKQNLGVRECKRNKQATKSNLEQGGTRLQEKALREKTLMCHFRY